MGATPDQMRSGWVQLATKTLVPGMSALEVAFAIEEPVGAAGSKSSKSQIAISSSLLKH